LFVHGHTGYSNRLAKAERASVIVRINAVNAKRREQLAELGTTLISLLGG